MEKDLAAVDSVTIYQPLWWCWHFCGIATTRYNKYLLGVYDLLLNFFITIYYPLHLFIGLLMTPSLADIFKNLSISITCTVCSVKHYLFRYRLRQLGEVEQLLGELDLNAVSDEERRFFNRESRVGAKIVMNLFIYAYAGANIAAASAVLLGSERRLMYPAYFPFDWQSSEWLYWFALIYQFLGVTIQIVQNLANDIYAPMTLCLLSGQVRLLSMRVAKLGTDGRKSEEEHARQLYRCIEDHKKLLKLFYVVQSSISYVQLIQFISSGLNICIVLIYLLFYVDNVFAYVYYIVYFIAMGIEIFPCCYYGSMLQLEFENLPYAIFKSNWLERSRSYRLSIRIFAELALKQVTAVAGGIIGIHLNAFFGTCKMAYSLFAVIIRMK